MSDGSWRERGRVEAGSWPAAAEAGRLLAALGADVVAGESRDAALAQGTAAVLAPATTPDEDWTASGAMALTGLPDSAPLHPTGCPATVAKAAAFAFELVSGAAVDGAALLSERAALMNLRRGGAISCGGGTRVVRAVDGWWALNLARDADLVPALLEEDPSDLDSWRQLTRWAAMRPLAQIMERATLLGLAASALGEVAAPVAPWTVRQSPGSRRQRHRPLVVNLGALWAGPLAAHLLGLAGAEVVDVESSTRPDPVRQDAPDFYALLHGGHDTASVDFTDPTAVRALLTGADVVIEASRPRALANLGASAARIMADGRTRTWLRITGHSNPQRVAFGDDSAVAGGLVAWSHGQPVFAGDAIADPLSGLLGALAVSANLDPTLSAVIDIHMSEVAAYCARDLHPVTVTPASAQAPREPRVAARNATFLQCELESGHDVSR